MSKMHFVLSKIRPFSVAVVCFVLFMFVLTVVTYFMDIPFLFMDIAVFCVFFSCMLYSAYESSRTAAHPVFSAVAAGGGFVLLVFLSSVWINGEGCDVIKFLWTFPLCILLCALTSRLHRK